MTTLPILIPHGFKPVVKIDDIISSGNVLAVKETIGEVYINVPRELEINIKSAKKCIKKVPGEKVHAGDVLAVKKGFFGGGTVLRSRDEGTLVRYERDSGNLVIALTINLKENTSEIVSPVEGVVKLCDNKEIVLTISGDIIDLDYIVGKIAIGELYFLENDDSYHINAQAVGKIIISNKLSREMILKGIGIGVSGLLGVTISDRDLEYVATRKISIPIARISQENLQKINNFNNAKAIIYPETNSIIINNL